MNRKSLYMLLLFLFVPNQTIAANLNRMIKVDLQDTVQLFLFFDKEVRYSTREKGKRLDLILPGTVRTKDFALFPPDDRVVKILAKDYQGQLILSFFFRYTPQKSEVRVSDKNKLVVDILLGNKYSGSYKKLSDRLKGLTLLDRSTVDLSNPYVRSPYKNDWWSFFATYSSPISISVPVRFTLPPFPLIALLPPAKKANLKYLSEKILEYADNTNWDQVKADILLKLENPGSETEKKLLALTLGEVLARDGDFENSYKQLYLLKENYPDEQLATYASFLLAYLEAVHQSPYLAHYTLPKMRPTIPGNLPLSPYYRLLQIEVALASSDFKTMNSLLIKDDIGFPGTLQQRVQIRQADYWYSIKQQVKAFAGYDLLGRSDVLWTQPYSVNGYCDTLYALKKHEAAAGCYGRLATLVTDKDLLAMINYRKYMAQLYFFPKADLLDDFIQLESAFPKGDLGLRAKMKRTDIELLQDKNELKKSSLAYHHIASLAVDRYVREEALFKEALTYALKKDNGKAIHLLQQLLRQFRVGNIQESAQALLISLLPMEIKRLADSGDYISALVLAKQNRVFFQNNWIDATFLVDIAESYRKVGLYDEAEKLYLYIIGVVPLDQRERYYLPMIISAFEQGRYTLVDDYSAQYTYNYPDGKSTNDILYYRLQALVSAERIEEAAQLIPSPLPEHKKIISLSALIRFRMDQYKECLQAINRLSSEAMTPRDNFLKAECSFQTGDQKQAEQIFDTIPESSPYYHQSLFRLSEIAQKKDQTEKSLIFLRKIVETGKDDTWKRLAERELQIHDTVQQIPLIQQ